MAEEEQATPANWNQKIIEEFRATGGKVGGPFAGSTLLLLTTTGARTGKPRTNPVAFLRDGERILIIASAAGAATNPDWYHNLVANPDVTVELGAETFAATAVPLRGEERDRLFAHVVQLAPGFGEYQAKTPRVIPVVALYRKP
jgi:deazaflavin-dependent oxidoreductase (nitroreductase family)